MKSPSNPQPGDKFIVVEEWLSCGHYSDGDILTFLSGADAGFYSVEHGQGVYISYREVQPYSADLAARDDEHEMHLLVDRRCNEMLRSFGRYYWGTPFDTTTEKTKKKKGVMSYLRQLTGIVKTWKQPLKNYYRLGWIELDSEYNIVLTSAGRSADAHARIIKGTTMEEYATEEIKRLEKLEEESK